MKAMTVGESMPVEWITNYMNHPRHVGWLNHYGEGNWGSRILAFSPEWGSGILPPGMGDSGFVYEEHKLRCVLMDTENATKYETTIVPAFVLSEAEIRDEEWRLVEGIRSLQTYFYSEHHCPCHRKFDLKNQCGLDVDDRCEGRRFIIERITPLDHKDLILLSESHSLKELEEGLLKGLEGR